MAAINDNIKALREHAGISQEELGKKIGKTRSAISQYESGKIIPRMGVIEQLASVFGVQKIDILGESYIASTHYEADQVEVPLYGAIAAGTPIEMIETEDNFPIPAQVHERHPDAFLLRVVGESMNCILPNGCYAVIDPCEDVEVNGQPYAVCVNGNDATIKRVDKLANGFRLKPDSTDPTYSEQTFNYNEPNTEEITVIGKVVYYVLPFDWGF